MARQTTQDIYAIEGIGALESLKYPNLLIDPKKVRHVLTTAISSAKHFAWVSESDAGHVEGVLIGVASDNLWAQRQNCMVTLWTSEIVGDGRRLMRKFLEWVDTRRIIRVVGIVPDNNEVDSRVWKLVERLGFRKYGGAYLIYN
jgi:hypothetical protein